MWESVYVNIRECHVIIRPASGEERERERVKERGRV
jgi:hypothetical protein